MLKIFCISNIRWYLSNGPLTFDILSNGYTNDHVLNDAEFSNLIGIILKMLCWFKNDSPLRKSIAIKKYQKTSQLTKNVHEIVFSSKKIRKFRFVAKFRFETNQMCISVSIMTVENISKLNHYRCSATSMFHQASVSPIWLGLRNVDNFFEEFVFYRQQLCLPSKYA